MTSRKKVYARPELIVHGNIETITQSGGGNRIDLPMGTVISPSDTINDVTS